MAAPVERATSERSPADQATSGQGMARAAEDQEPLRPALTLTEEELWVLTDGTVSAVPPQLAEPEDPAAADLIRSVALRALMARGLVLPREARRDGVAWEAAEPLGLALQLRELAPTVLGLHRSLGPLAPDPDGLDPDGPEDGVDPEGTSAVRYLHLHAELGVIEDVTDDGMHSLLPVFPDRYREAVAAFIRPPDAVAGRGGVRRLGDSVVDLLDALGSPTVLVEASLVTGIGPGGPPPEPVGQLLAFGPGGSFRSHDSLSYHPVDPDGAIADLLREAQAGDISRE